MLSAGRDRQFSIFKRIDGQTNFELVCKQAKAHDRIIWSCDWSHDDKYFVTGSRDKSCKIWTIDSDTNTVKLFGKFSPAKIGVNAVSFAPRKVRTLEDSEVESYMIAVGLENGLIQLWTFIDGGAEFSCYLHVPAAYVY